MPDVDPRPLSKWSETLDLHADERPPWPADAVVTLKGASTRLGNHDVRLGGSLATEQAGCSAWPLPPLMLSEGRWTSARALPPIDQRLEIHLDPPQGLVRFERIVDTPQSRPSLGHWPRGWTLEATVDDAPATIPRVGDVVLWPAFRRLVLAGDGPLPEPSRLDTKGLTLDTPPLVADRVARSTGLAILRSPFHIEPGRGQRAEGSTLLVAGVRFPHHATGDGIRVLANDATANELLDALLALRADSAVSWPRPLFVIPGATDRRRGDTLALSPDAWSDEGALRKAVWHLTDMDDGLRRSFQALEGPASPAPEPRCYGLRSRPELDRSRLLAQVLLVDPGAATATSWFELEERHPWLTPWLDAPSWPQLEEVRTADSVRWIDTAETGLPLRLPVVIDGARRVIGLDEPMPASARLAPGARLPVRR